MLRHTQDQIERILFRKREIENTMKILGEPSRTKFGGEWSIRNNKCYDPSTSVNDDNPILFQGAVIKNLDDDSGHSTGCPLGLRDWIDP